MDMMQPRPRNFRCPLSAALCVRIECSITRCREADREKIGDLRRQAEAARRRWQRCGADDRREAALLRLREIADQQGIPVPSGPKQKDLIRQVLLSERHAERVRWHINAISAEREEAKKLPRSGVASPSRHGEITMIKISTPYSLKIRRALIWPTAPSSGADEREFARPAPRPEPRPSPKQPGEHSMALAKKQPR